MKIAKAMPSVMLGSVVGTTLKYSIPSDFASSGIKSTGTRSIRFINKIHTKTVRASGAISLLLVEPKRDWTLSSTNSIHISTKFCKPDGVSVFLGIAHLKMPRNRAPRKTDQPIESTLNAQKPISAA